MTTDKQKLQKLLWSEVASWKADCGEWKQSAEALGEFLGEKTVEEVALELLAENETIKSQFDECARLFVDATELACKAQRERDQFKAENEALRSQVQALQANPNSWQSGYDEGRRMGTKHRADEVDHLKAEVEALRKDAERYRWLRAENAAGPNIQVSEWIGPHEYQLYTAELDAAVDAAMGQGVQP